MRRVVQADRVRYLRDDARGLSELEVEARRARHGANDIVETAPSGWRDVLRDTVKDPMLWFLAATSALFAVVGDYGEAAIMVDAQSETIDIVVRRKG